MPRIERIRITGVQYENMRKRHEDTVLDLGNDEAPQHTLITLVNGGGKGLLLQMIFQLLLPKTTWGKNGENRVEALFYNERKTFKPYTFHVGIEWRLDTDTPLWLLTGIAMTARERFKAEEGEEAVSELQYLLYTQTYRKPHEWELTKMPLYDKERKEGVEMAELKTFLNRHRSIFQTFPPSRLRDYYDYLSSFGIEKGDWQVMRNINKEEGGVEAFFRDGQDNDALFRHKIIPTISEHMQSEESEGLLPLFRSSVKIAQELPKLLARESAYRELQELIKPLKEAFEKGVAEARNVEEHREQGELLLSGLHGWHETLLGDIEKWKEEKEGEERHWQDLLWQEANLRYARKNREAEEIQKRLQATVEEKERLSERERALAQEEELARLHYLLRQWSSIVKEESEVSGEMESLRQSMESSAEMVRYEELRGQLAEEWERVAAIFAKQGIAFERAKAALEKYRADAEREKEETEKKLSTVRVRIELLTEKIKEFTQQMTIMGNRYGVRVNEDPEAVLREQERVYQRLRQAMEELARQREENLLAEKSIIREESVLGKEMEQRQAELTKLKEHFDRRRQEEEALYARFRQWFPDWEVSDRLGMEWLKEAKQRLEEKMAKTEGERKREEEAYWSHQLDRVLQTEEYWVPNRELAELYRLLVEANVTPIYGTQLLKEMPPAEAELLLKEYPLLPYGLVVWRREEMRLKQLFSAEAAREWFFRAPVPIFLRESMTTPESTSEEGEGWISDRATLYVRDFGWDLTLQDETWQAWRASLEEKEARLKSALSALEERVVILRDLMEGVHQLLREAPAVQLQEQMENVRGLIAAARNRMEELRRQGEDLKMAQHRIEKEIKGTEDLMRKQEKTIDELKGWIERVKEYKTNRAEREEQKQALAQLEQEKKGKERWLHHLSERIDDVKDNEREWKNTREKLLDEVRQILAEASIPTGVRLQPTDEEFEPIRIIEGRVELHLPLEMDVEPLHLMVREGENLKRSIAERNTRLQILQERYEQRMKERRKKEEELADVRQDWQSFTLSAEAEEVLKRRWQTLMEEHRKVEKELHDTEVRLGKVESEYETTLGHLQELALEIVQRFAKEADPWATLSLEGKAEEIKKEKAESEKRLKEMEDLLDELKRQATFLQQGLVRLQDQGLRLKRTLDIPPALLEAVKNEPEKKVQEWINTHERIKNLFNQHMNSIEKERSRLIRQLDEASWDTILKENLKQAINELDRSNLEQSLEVLESILLHAVQELSQLQKDKREAEEARDRWVERAAYRVIRIIREMRKMESSMTITNQNKHRYPLIRMKLSTGSFPDQPEAVKPLLNDFFLKTMERLIKTYEEVDRVPEAAWEEAVNDSEVVHVALSRRFPTFMVYKPQTVNSFLYETPKEHHYTEWQTINKGSLTEGKGSGGQLLAVRTIVMMMLITYRHHQQGGEAWTVLISDNPFGQAVSAHILDPIFAIAENLRFQWIVVSPPELIKLDVSRRFPVYWELKLIPIPHGEQIVEELHHGGRQFKGELTLFDF